MPPTGRSEASAAPWLGSVKSNIGHTQAAAGVAGVIKMVEALRHEELPASLHVDAPSSNVDWEAGEVELLTEPVPWPANGRPRRAGVSSFGISGTNAHVIVEEPPAPPQVEAEADGTGPAVAGPVPLLLSAKDPEALAEAAGRLAARIEADPEARLTDLGYSLATTRAHLPRRAAVIATEREEALTALGSLAEGRPAAATVEGTATTGRLAWLLTGQGSQRPGMGLALAEASPLFAAALAEVSEEIDPHLDRPLADLLGAEPGSEAAALLDHTTYAQPAIFAVGLALHRLLASLGLRPELLAGHSIGELTAAHISGVLSLPDAAKLVAARGRLMGELPEGGAMVAIEATEAELSPAIADHEGVSLAGVNGPSAVVISGVEEEVLAVKELFEERGRRTKRLAVSHAFHSHLMDPMLGEFEALARSLTYNEPRIPILSTVDGRSLAGRATDPAYWVGQVREPVRFADAVGALAAEGATTFIELGPDAVLSALGPACLPEGAEATFIPTLREGHPEPEALTTALAAAHTRGAAVEWQSFFAGSGARRVPLPTYPFQRRRYWLQSSTGAGDLSALGLGSRPSPSGCRGGDARRRPALHRRPLAARSPVAG